ncbi:MAG: putative 2-aminoethylphosphonate ABC transporter ATP-binding protein [Granulosicoccus sp.]
MNDSYLKIKELSKNFGSFKAVQNISIDIQEGEFICFLGPSGCGKTTLLRCIAGLEIQTSGSIVQNGVDISSLPPSSREFGIVFQSYALFPNLTVFSNIAYGLINHKWHKKDIKNRVDELLNLVGLTNHASKYPGQLSGGEQQRVALARAITTSPGLLLLDEPLSALDAKVRVYLRKQIKGLHKKLGVTTIMVTHDQEEAQSMADRIFVMKDGEVIQVGTPKEIYTRANSPFIADFIGTMNFISGTVVDTDTVQCKDINITCNTQLYNTGQNVKIAIRPESIMLYDPKNPANTETLENNISANIDEIEFLGSFQRIYLEAETLSNELIMVDIPSSKARNLEIQDLTSMSIQFPSEDIRIYTDDA